MSQQYNINMHQRIIPLDPRLLLPLHQLPPPPPPLSCGRRLLSSM